jgi:hypothetical protein
MASPLFFTVVTKSHLPYARLLHERLRLHEADFEFLAFLIDGEDGCVDFKREAFPVVRAEDFLPAEQFRLMRFWYTANEFCNAAKAFAHQYILQHRSDPCWFYLDSDLYPVASLSPAFAALEGHDLLITPHCLLPVTAPEAAVKERNLLDLGVFNGGFVGLRRGPAAVEFCRWFSRVLFDGCRDKWGGMFVDQKWLNLAPCLHPSLKIWHHPGGECGVLESARTPDGGPARCSFCLGRTSALPPFQRISDGESHWNLHPQPDGLARRAGMGRLRHGLCGGVAAARPCRSERLALFPCYVSIGTRGHARTPPGFACKHSKPGRPSEKTRSSRK